MREKTGTLGQSCLLLLAVAYFTTPAHTQQASTDIAQSLQRGAQVLGREALWTAAAASTFIPGQGALQEAAQSALHSGAEVYTFLYKRQIAVGRRKVYVVCGRSLDV